MFKSEDQIADKQQWNFLKRFLKTNFFSNKIELPILQYDFLHPTLTYLKFCDIFV